MSATLTMMALTHEDAGHLPDARDREPLVAFLRHGGLISQKDLVERKKAPASSPYEETQLAIDVADLRQEFDPRAETRRMARVKPEWTVDVSQAAEGHRERILACLDGALRADTELAKEIRKKVAGQTLKIVSAESRTGYHAWQDDAGNLLDILYRVEGAPLKTETKGGVTKDNLGNGLVELKDGTWKLVRSMLDYGV